MHRTGWDEGILGSYEAAPMSLGEKATLTITPYVTPLQSPASRTEACLK